MFTTTEFRLGGTLAMVNLPWPNQTPPDDSIAILAGWGFYHVICVSQRYIQVI